MADVRRELLKGQAHPETASEYPGRGPLSSRAAGGSLVIASFDTRHSVASALMGSSPSSFRVASVRRNLSGQWPVLVSDSMRRRRARIIVELDQRLGLFPVLLEPAPDDSGSPSSRTISSPPQMSQMPSFFGLVNSMWKTWPSSARCGGRPASASPRRLASIRRTSGQLLVKVGDLGGPVLLPGERCAKIDRE